MPDLRFDVTGIGNAIVDVLSHAEDDFIFNTGFVKGSMTLVDRDAANRLYRSMGPAVECSGGSAANTIAGIAGLGGKAAYMGKVGPDMFGQIFRHDIRTLGVTFDTPDAEEGPPTATSFVMVSPDAQRTMVTYLGACVNFSRQDLDLEAIAASKVLYLEGYLWDPSAAKDAFRVAAKTAKDAGRMVSLSLSDPFCVERHRGDFLDLISGSVDILFANEDEIKSLFEVDDFDAALDKVRGYCGIAALTRSEKGSVVVEGETVHTVPAFPVKKVVDTTGAGDAYAAGFLAGFTQDKDLETCARMGGIIAAEVIQHMGARPDTDLKALVADQLG